MENCDWNLCPIQGFPGSLQDEIATRYVHGFPVKVRMASGVGDLLHIWNCLIKSAAAAQKEGLQRLMMLQLITEVQKKPEFAVYFPTPACQMDAERLGCVKEALTRSIKGEMEAVAKYFEGPTQVSVVKALWNEPAYCAVQYQIVLKAYLLAVESESEFDEGEDAPWIYSKSFQIQDLVTYMTHLGEKLRKTSIRASKYLEDYFKDLDLNVLEQLRWSHRSETASGLGGLRYCFNCLFELVTSLIQVYSKLERSVSEVYVPSSATCSVTAIRILHKLRLLQAQLLEKCIVVTRQPPKCLIPSKTGEPIEIQPLLDIVNLEDCDVELVALDAKQADSLKLEGQPYPDEDLVEVLKLQIEEKKRTSQEESISASAPYGSICRWIQVRGKLRLPAEAEPGSAVNAKFQLLIRTKFKLGKLEVPTWTCSAPFTVATSTAQIAAGTASVLWQEAFPALLPSNEDYFNLPVRTSPLNALEQAPLKDVVDLCIRYLKEATGLPFDDVLPPLCRAFLHDKLREIQNAQGFISMTDFCRQKDEE